MTEERDREAVAQALQEAGIPTNDVYDLVNQRGGSGYREAIPALVSLLPALGRNKIKEGVVRALGVREARGVALAPLVRELSTFAETGFSGPFDFHLAWAISNSISEIAEDHDFDAVKTVLLDIRLGRSRQMLPYAFAKMKSMRQAAIPLLTSLLDDDEIRAHVIDVLVKLKASEALPKIVQYATDDRPLVRSEVKKAIKKLAS